MGTDSATVLLDLKKLYEHVRHVDLFAAARQFDFNIKLLRGVVTIYSGFRTLLCDGAISEFVQATGAIVAGCSAATTLAKLLLVGPHQRSRPWQAPGAGPKRR